MILFVASNPSKLNKNPRIAMVGAKCEKTFNDWVEYLSPDRNYVVINASNKILEGNNVIRLIDIDFDNLTEWTKSRNVTKIVALGNVAAKALSYIGVEYYKLPHPSSRNRLLNNKEQVAAVLKNCKQWLRV